MAASTDPLAMLTEVNGLAAFNRWAGIEVTAADEGTAQIQMPWREEFGQFTGFLHAGLVSALVDTACGFAAATLAGTSLLASHCAVNYLSPAVGEVFLSRALVVKAGKRQLFVSADLLAQWQGQWKVIASGETILIRADD